MNDKTKRYMEKQRKGLYEVLYETFQLNVYEDEIAEDEEEELLKSKQYNFFTIDYGDFSKAGSENRLGQIVYVDYYSEGRNDVDDVTIDVLTKVKGISGFVFVGTKKERLQMAKTERYVDRVTFTFRRLIPLEC